MVLNALVRRDLDQLVRPLLYDDHIRPTKDV